MNQRAEIITAADKAAYSSPSISIVNIANDIITESHNDPNMGEWDTEI